LTYTVKEIFKTIQGEGTHSGWTAVFCRFAGCNLWSGREQDRAGAICKFCDTDFVKGRKYETAVELAIAIENEWGPNTQNRMVVLTGGEPVLQYDQPLYGELSKRGFYIAIETNGTLALKAHVHWLCLSPKAGTSLQVNDADELKVAYPQDMDLSQIPVSARIKSVQPIDGPQREKNTEAAIKFCFANPEWRLSLQTHKFVGLR
jgi:7-carboxy-7-deazaguanine synthase